MTRTVFQRIEDVLRQAGHPIAAHEFQSVFISMPVDHLGGGRVVDGRFYVGSSESTISRELRKMRELNLVTSQVREGKSFKEYKLVVKVPTQPDFAFLKV